MRTAMADRIPPPASAATGTHCTPAQYDELYARSLSDPDSFWAEQAQRIDWVTPPSKISNWSYDPVEIKWFEDGVLNLCYNCVDRHLAERSAETAILFEGDKPGVTRRLSYGELHAEVVRMANCLKALGAGKGDRITLYMPTSPEAIVLMLAIVRIGAIHSIVFAGFGARALAQRIEASGSSLVFTSDVTYRKGRDVALKPIVSEAIDLLSRSESPYPRVFTFERERSETWEAFLRLGHGHGGARILHVLPAGHKGTEP